MTGKSQAGQVAPGSESAAGQSAGSESAAGQSVAGHPTWDLPAAGMAALVVVRDGRLPAGADEAVAEAGGLAVVVGTGAAAAAPGLASATACWWAETRAGPGGLAAVLSPALAHVGTLVVPASPDGRDVGARLAGLAGRTLLAGAVAVQRDPSGRTHADLLRIDGRVVVPASVSGPVVATLLPGAGSPVPAGSTGTAALIELALEPGPANDGSTAAAGPAIDPADGADAGRGPATDPTGGADATAAPGPTLLNSAAIDAEVLALVEPDPATMDLADATRVLGGGAGLVRSGTPDGTARAIFDLLIEVAAALGASAGATRVVTDAGWIGPERQIGTTGVAVHPELYVALGVSGATQHTGGLGSPGHTVSVNTDPACPMTALADLGLVADALGLLVELAARVGAAVPAAIEEMVHAPAR